MSETSDDLRAQETRAAQRGFLVITGAKVWFLLTATVINLGLPRLLGDPASFGDFTVVNRFISILNMVIITSALQAVSKRVSELPDSAWYVRRAALRLMTVVGLVLLALVMAGADYIATWLFRDPSLAWLLRIAVLITFAYGEYAVIIGLLNGLKKFTKQALFDVSFATLKVVLIIGAVLAGFSVGGAISAFAAAAIIVAVAAYLFTRRLFPQPSASDVPEPPRVRLVAFMVQVMGYALLVNVLLQGDVIVLKAATYGPVLESFKEPFGVARLELIQDALGSSMAAHAEGLATQSTAVLSGLFGAIKNISLIPYQAVIAITFVIFPLISRATFQVDAEATRSYVRQTFRIAMLIVLLLAVVLAVGGEPLLAMLFGDAYRVTAPALLPLLLGMACFALIFVLGSILTAGGHPRDAMLVAALAVALQLSSLFVVIGAVVPGPAVIHHAALVTFGAIAVSLVVGCIVVSWRLEVRLPLLAIVRILAAAAAAFLSAIFIPMGGFVGIFVRVGVACVVFVVVAVVTREITRDDLRSVRSTLAGRKKG